jgi:hypothetical protein
MLEAARDCSFDQESQPALIVISVVTNLFEGHFAWQFFILCNKHFPEATPRVKAQSRVTR